MNKPFNHMDPDAQNWADEFIRLFPNTGLDRDILIGWFASAIMCGWDTAINRIREGARKMQDS